MRKSILAATALIVAFSNAFIADASASQLPADQSLSFKIHEDPFDPSSAESFTVFLSLSAKSSASGEVGWEVTSITIRRHDAGGNVDWKELLPYVDTADGLWWVAHDDILAPTLDEFTDPPFISGTALAEDPNDDDLDYDFEGTTYQVPPGGEPYTYTAGVSYWFQLASEPEPEEEDDEVPADLGDHDE